MKYTGRFSGLIKELEASNTRYNIKYIENSNYISCNICSSLFSPPTRDKNYNDALDKCPKCSAPCLFIFS